jgi:hypothetical protein
MQENDFIRPTSVLGKGQTSICEAEMQHRQHDEDWSSQACHPIHLSFVLNAMEILCHVGCVLVSAAFFIAAARSKKLT